ncbi:MAG: hypothetical protein LUC90_09245 [Lachnospiraceae bacterium]|nr:hypothetical protein [Lachnospiraceae bacterium]
MDYELVPVVQTVAEYMPPKKIGHFENAMEVAHLLLDHEPVSIIAHTVDNAFQTFGMIRELKYRADVVKYCTHMEEVRMRTSVELARIQQQERIAQLYLEKHFQETLDNMERSYLDHSSRLDYYGQVMIREIDRRVNDGLRSMDRYYINAVRENEMKCGLYRSFLTQVFKEGVDRHEVLLFTLRKLGENMDRLSDDAVLSVCGVVQDMMKYDPTVSFEEYIQLSNDVSKINKWK